MKEGLKDMTKLVTYVVASKLQITAFLLDMYS